MKYVNRIAAVLLGLIALLQGLRFYLGWEVTVNGLVIPLAVSVVAFLICGALALLLWRNDKNKP